MRVRIEDFVIDSELAEASLAGEAVAIEAQVFDLLCLLVAERARVVSKDKIVGFSWDDRNASDAGISTCTKPVRKDIGDDGD